MANEIFKSKGVLIGSAAVALIAVGGVAAYVISQNSTAAPAPDAGGAAAPAAPVAGGPGTAGAPPTLALPKTPAGASTPAAAGAKPAAGAKAKLAVATPPKPITNSWDELLPPAAPGAPVPPGGPAGGAAPGAAPAGGAAAAPAAGAKPSPIVDGQLAAAFRPDPFVSFTRRLVEAIPTYTLIAHERLAARPKPTPPPAPTDPYLRFGPLPQVERRIAGILFDGSVSAILETGTPGAASTRVSVIQPGSLVPSGVPGLRDLTVASITATEVVLRADDGRTTTVKLSSVPAAYAEAFRGAASGGDTPGGGAPPPSGPNGPGGPIGPGRGPGGAKGGFQGGGPVRPGRNGGASL